MVYKKTNEEFKKAFKKRCFLFSANLIKISTELYNIRKNWVILDQLLRSGTSIGANVVEGGSSISKKEFISYFQISLKSSSESLYWLALLREINHSYRTQINDLINECIELKKILITILKNTKASL